MARPGGKDRGITQRKGREGWWVRIFHNGRERWHKCDSKSQAKALYGRLKAEVREGRYFPKRFNKPKDVTLQAWIKRYLETSTNLGIGNEKRYGRRWSFYLGKRLLSDITTEELRRIQSRMRARRTEMPKGKRAKKGMWSDATINRHVAFIRHVLNLAAKDELITRNPATGMALFPEGHRTRFLAHEELVRLKNLMGRADWNMVAFAIETGLRRAEQFNLRWEHVSMEAGVLTIPLPKGGRTRHVPLSNGAKSVLRTLDSFVVSPWVFPGIIDPLQPMDSRAFLRRAFEPALKRAGIMGASWHTLRHTAASRRVMAGVDLVAVKEMLGHRDIETTMRYSHLSPGHLHEAVNRGSLLSNRDLDRDQQSGKGEKTGQAFEYMVRPAGIEPATPRSVV